MCKKDTLPKEIENVVCNNTYGVTPIYCDYIRDNVVALNVKAQDVNVLCLLPLIKDTIEEIYDVKVVIRNTDVVIFFLVDFEYDDITYEIVK